MKICVFGLSHLGSTTAACLADAGFLVVGLDSDKDTVARLKQGRAPLHEPGLDALIQAGVTSKKLTFTVDASEATLGADLVWVCFDTPVDENDVGDTGFVASKIKALLPKLGEDCTVLVSSQMPAGSIAALEARAADLGRSDIRFAYSPENLRLGQAINAFRHPGRIVIGVRSADARNTIEPVMSKFCDTLLWTRVESAEMLKHALNGFLALSVTFTNEIAAICERLGGDAFEVERALKLEPRIGQKAYVRPGAAFAGGTLARDVEYLRALAKTNAVSIPLIDSILPSNNHHRGWMARAVKTAMGKHLQDARVAILGLSYKPDTDSIRRSMAIDLIKDLMSHGPKITAFDPAVKALPSNLSEVTLAGSLNEALEGAQAVIIATNWPEFKTLQAKAAAELLAPPAIVIDQDRFLDPAFESTRGIGYICLGRGLNQ